MIRSTEWMSTKPSPPIASVLLAAGRGERLRPLSDRLPKPALPVLDVPLGAFPLAKLLAARPPVVVNVHHLGEVAVRSLESALGEDRFRALLESPEAYGTAGTIRALGTYVDDPVVTWNCDVIADLDVGDLLAAHEAAGLAATVAVRRVDAGADLELSGGRATGFIDRRHRADAPGGVFLGVAALGAEAVAAIPDRRPAGLGETVLRVLAEAGRLAVVEHEGYWIDVGDPGGYLRASLDVLAGIAPRPPVQVPGRVVEVAGGRAYVGARAYIEEKDLGPGAIVLAGARVGAGSRVERAIVWPDEVVPAGSLVREAVWAEGRPLPPTFPW